MRSDDRPSILSGMALNKHMQKLRAKWLEVRGCSKFAHTKYLQTKKRRENNKRRRVQNESKDQEFPQLTLE